MPSLEEIEAALLTSPNDRSLLVAYADALQRRGDLRGELLALDLQRDAHGASDELAQRKRDLIEAWLGPSIADRVLEIGAVEHGWFDLRWPVEADEIEPLLAGPLGSCLRTLMVQDRDPGLRRVIDRLGSRSWPWLETFQLLRYPDGFNPELAASVAIDDERARAFVTATPHLRRLVVAGANAFGELVHPSVRELRTYDYNAIGPLLAEGPSFSALASLDLQLMERPPELTRLLPVGRFPALRRLDLARNERHREEVLELIQHHPLIPQLTWLRTPSLRTDAHLDAVERAAARMATNAELVVVRAYPGLLSRSPSPRVTLPPAVPWPPSDALGSSDWLVVSIPGGSSLGASPLHEVVRVLERSYDSLPEQPRSAWSELWRRFTELGPGDSKTPRSGTVSAELLAAALAPLDFKHEREWGELRAAVARCTDPQLTIRLSLFLDLPREVGPYARWVQEREAALRAQEQAEIAANAAAPVDPAVVAELEKIDRLVIEELRVSLPLPLFAELQTPTNDRTVTFLAPAELARVAALYRSWAPAAGWLFKIVLDNDRFSVFELRRDGIEIGVRLNPWIAGRLLIAIELPRSLATTVVPGPKSVIATPTLPPITRERLPAMPSEATSLDRPRALLADGGLVFVADNHGVWMVDPHARERTLVAAKLRGPTALAPDGAGLLAVSSMPLTLHQIGRTGATPIVVDDRAYGIALCRLGSTAFIGCDDGRILAVKLPTGEVVADIARFTKELRALTVADATLYALDARVISAIDPTTHQVTKLIELPRGASALASDGERLYTLHDSAIGCVDLATRSFTQCAGQPQFDVGQMLLADQGAARDGAHEVAVLDSARFLSYDAGNLWFTDNARLRRFEISARYTWTLELA